MTLNYSFQYVAFIMQYNELLLILLNHSIITKDKGSVLGPLLLVLFTNDIDSGIFHL